MAPAENPITGMREFNPFEQVLIGLFTAMITYSKELSTSLIIHSGTQKGNIGKGMLFLIWS